ncbi:MAG: hypothetical protein EP343_06070 [Deltaproteobacteria bacterium]|nr:MAG: hypothetical protein EP343_06070 [Deltaproteobacteria bacterium]
MTKKPKASGESSSEPASNAAWSHLNWEELEESPPSVEELAQAEEMALWMDSLLEGTRDSESPIREPSFSLEEAEELAAMGMLLRHANEPPTLTAQSKQRVEDELLSFLPAPEKEQAPKDSWWATLLGSMQLLLQRPVMAAMAVVLLSVGSWGVWQSQQPSEVRRGFSVAASSGQSLFGGTLSKASTNNPFQETRSAAERLDRVTQQLGQWQRNRWGQQLRRKRYGNF